MTVVSLFTDDFIQARWYYQGRTRKVRLGVLHATQSPERKGAARGVANDFASRPSTNKASAHVVNDADESIGCVAAGDTAFAVPNANADGFHIEQVGYSEQSLEDWSDDYSQAVIARSARTARQASELFGLPKDWRGVDAVRDGASGWTDHATCSIALGGSHWDPGPAYPRDLFMSLLLDQAHDPIPPPITEEEMGNSFITEFKDQAGTLWLVDPHPEPRTNANDAVLNGFGTRKSIPSPEWAGRLIAAGIPRRPFPIEGMTMYREVK